mgnify:CR=1 FL=1
MGTIATYQTTTLSDGDAVKVTVSNNNCSATSATLNANIGDTEKPVPIVATLANITGQCSATAIPPMATQGFGQQIVRD